LPNIQLIRYAGGYMSEDEDYSEQISEEESPKKYRSRRQRRNRNMVLVSLIFIILIVGFLIYYPRVYNHEDHSPYNAALATESYDQNGLNVSFAYPSSMSQDDVIAKKLPSTPIAYSYRIEGALEAVVGVSYEKISNPLKFFSLTPAQYLNQLATGKGSYINYLNEAQKTTNAYAKDFPGCNKEIQTTSSETALLCVNQPGPYLNARLIGVTKNYQYTLELEMRPNLWTAHQMTWQAVEKSFNFK
jgi:hypothetical protein